MKSVEPLPTSNSQSMRVTLWEERLSSLLPATPMALNPCDELSV